MFQGEWDFLKRPNPLLGALPLAGLGALMNKKHPVRGAVAGLAASQLFPMLSAGFQNRGMGQGESGMPSMPLNLNLNNALRPQAPPPQPNPMEIPRFEQDGSYFLPEDYHPDGSVNAILRRRFKGTYQPSIQKLGGL